MNMLARCVEAATLAPSLHNSQPWRFRVTGREVRVYADRSRRLDALDSSGRELLISVGAALFTLRLALRAQAWRTTYVLFPEPDSSELVARVLLDREDPPPESVTTLAEAIARRHTNRLPFADAAVSADAIEELRTAAADQGAALTIAGPATRNAILALGHQAERHLRAKGRYRAELSRWTRPAPGRHDGVPPAAVGPWDALERMPIRDFGLVHPQPWRTNEFFEAHPTIAVLATAGDGPDDWVRAGQALQHVLLAATRLRLATTPISQPIEVPAIRELLTDTSAGRWAQMIIRVGYGPPAAVTPRRPLSEVLTESDQ
ncbi:MULTISPECIES: nitroreductase family protein [unclassified Micromonospora]|uniref:Acg family FMN-binding oxidoreductase n=1 Tax=unclassified Micromonospora TaxID=2617518 RepID=UPI001C2433CD|nr:MULTISPECIES: nitroreductase family protein [unclassified Micromonospora]MBU8860276.1 nitroreductase family protein [Micromonospora sp. WMMB482]MDM4779809.1 nitroreductase family protein [Micromonospora sp. b486]